MNSPDASPSPKPPPRLLIVEDNADNRDILTRRLTRRGFSVVAVGDGFEGLRLALRDFPDLIILDLEMPGMDGYQFLGQLRAHAPTAAIPVIVVTAHVLDDFARRAVQAGANDFDTKPINFPRLVAKILLLLGRASVPAPPPAQG